MYNSLLNQFIKENDSALRKNGEIIHPRKFIVIFKELISEINTSRKEEDKILFEGFGDAANRQYRLTDKLIFSSSIVGDADVFFDFYIFYKFIDMTEFLMNKD